MSEIAIEPGASSLGDRREVYAGAKPRLDEACWSAVDASAQAVARILTKGEPDLGLPGILG